MELINEPQAEPEPEPEPVVTLLPIPVVKPNAFKQKIYTEEIQDLLAENNASENVLLISRDPSFKATLREK